MDLKQDKAWGAIESRYSVYVSLSRMDLISLLEQGGVIPPVAFRSKDLLLNWANKNGLHEKPIFGKRITSAVRIAGDFRCPNGVRSYYDLIWVRSHHKTYRKAMTSSAEGSYKLKKANLAGLDADHVINRARLKKLPDSWVLLFPVPNASNSPFGRIERLLPQYRATTKVITLPPLIALKILSAKCPSTKSELNHALKDVDRQLLRGIPHIEAFSRKIKEEAHRHFR